MMNELFKKMGLKTFERCIGCDKAVSEIDGFWKYVKTDFGLKPLCAECALKKGIELIDVH